MRPATANDASAYLRMGIDAYPSEFHESSAAFLAKLRVFPSGCKIVDVAGESVAFLISHPWTYENPPKLNSEALTLPLSPDVFFIHSVKRRLHCLGVLGAVSPPSGKAVEGLPVLRAYAGGRKKNELAAILKP